MAKILKDISSFRKPYWIELGSGGSGRENQKEWIHCDPYIPEGEHHIEIECFAWELPFENNSVERIYLRGVWEHMSYQECRDSVKEWSRVLIVGGIIEFNFPPIDDYIRRYNQGEVDWIFIQGACWGWQKFPTDVHKSGWTKQIAVDFLSEFKDLFEIELFPGYHDTPGNIIKVESLESWDAGVHIWVRIVKK